MKTSTVSTAPRRSLPMPLWMQSFLELLLTTILSYLIIALIIVAVWMANGFDSQNIQGAATLTGNIWLLIHGVPLHLNIPNHGAIAAISGTMAYIPLGLTLIPLLLTFHSGRKLARASYEGQFWIPLTSGLIAYALFATCLSYFCSTDIASSDLFTATLIPCWVVGLGIMAGGLYESRSLSGMIGVNAADSVKKYSQYSRWAGSYLWAVVQASFIAPLALCAGGALLAAFSIFYNWNDILSIYQSLHAGAVGDTALTFLQLGILPNLIAYAMSYSTGAGFALGQGSSINWNGAQVGALPLLPLLGAVPNASAPWSYITVIVPIIAGILAGWWFFRQGENHLDEWLSLKIKFRPISWLFSHLALALLMGTLSGLWSGLFGWAAHGSLGLGKFTDIGPNPLIFALYAAIWFALGILGGSFFGRVFEKDAKVSLQREEDAVLISKKDIQKSEGPAKKNRLMNFLGFSHTSEGSQENIEETKSTKKIQEVRTRSSSAQALQEILGEELLVEEEKTETPEEPGTEEIKEEVPWWEKHTLIREPQKARQQEEKSSETETIEETSNEEKTVQSKRSGLSRGRVIRRPKAKKKTKEN